MEQITKHYSSYATWRGVTRRFNRDSRKMAAEGWHLQSQSSSYKAWGFAKHNIVATYTRGEVFSMQSNDQPHADPPSQPSSYPVYPAPPPPPQPSRRPGRATRFQSWYREQPLFMKVLVWIGVLFVVSAAITGVVQGIQESFALTPTPTSSQATSAPTQVPKTTATPKPLSIAQRVQQLADGIGPIGTNITAKYDSTTNAVSITEYLDTNSQLNNGSIIFSIKSDCFNIQQAIWHVYVNEHPDHHPQNC